MLKAESWSPDCNVYPQRLQAGTRAELRVVRMCLVWDRVCAEHCNSMEITGGSPCCRGGGKSPMNTRRAGMWDLLPPPSFSHFTPSLRLPQGLGEQGHGIYPSAFNTSES